MGEVRWPDHGPGLRAWMDKLVLPMPCHEFIKTFLDMLHDHPTRKWAITSSSLQYLGPPDKGAMTASV